MTAKEAFDLKFCDEISDAIKIAAKANVKGVKRQLWLNTLTSKNIKEGEKIMKFVNRYFQENH